MERLADIIERWLAGRQIVGVCVACRSRASLSDGAICPCGGIVVRVGA